MEKILTLITCVTNGGGVGPGHTALAVDDLVYSFENTGDWFSIGNGNKSGWITVDFDKFLAKNEFRPVIMQTLNTKVRSDYAERYIKASMDDDDDYLSSGVCCSQVSRAIDAGMIPTFDPPGIDTPKKVYDHARKMGIVSAENAVWPGTASMPVSQWASIVLRLKQDYRNVKIDVDR